MSEPALSPSLPCPAQAAPLSLLSAVLALLAGGTALASGLAFDSPALGGFGAASLLQVPLALSLAFRIRTGLGNRGLEREMRSFRVISFALRLLALALAAVAGIALLGRHLPDTPLAALGVALLSLGLQAVLWRAKVPLAGFHPSLALDAARARTLLELAGILLVGTVASRWFPLADAVAALALAARIYMEGRALGLLSAFKAACGGCGTGCGC